MRYYANCSESTLRINTTNLTEREILQLKKKYSELAGLLEQEESDLGEENIFGIKVLSHRGDFPHNNSDEIESMIKQFKLVINKDIEFEFSD